MGSARVECRFWQVRTTAETGTSAMNKKDASPSFDERDDRTIFQPASSVPGKDEASSGVSEAVGPDPAEECTVFRPSSADKTRGVEPRGAAAERTFFDRGPLLSGPAAPPPPRQAAVQTLELEAPNENPFLQAAGPLLLLLGRLRTSLLRARGPSLVAQIAAAIEKSEREMVEAGIGAADVMTAKYALCASADEVLANLPGDDRAPAQRSGLMTRFFGENDGRRRFFDELDRLKEHPQANRDLLGLFHACLALTFHGATTSLPGGTATLQAIRDDLFDLLEQDKAKAALALSPRWQGQPLPSHAARLRVPLWTVAGLAGLVLFLVFMGFRMSLGQRSETAATALTDLTPSSPVAIGRKAPVAPPPAPPPSKAQVSQIEHIRKVLEPNISAGALNVEATANQIIIHITDRVLFQPGKATVLEDVRPLIMYIALALDDAKGPIKVVGHSDNIPISNARFASNFELSLERAAVVGALLKQNLSQPERVEVEGKGADVPIAPNDTADGRAKNRRVEIVMPRLD
jgi:type VI secretion system protein ImpK